MKKIKVWIFIVLIGLAFWKNAYSENTDNKDKRYEIVQVKNYPVTKDGEAFLIILLDTKTGETRILSITDNETMWSAPIKHYQPKK